MLIWLFGDLFGQSLAFTETSTYCFGINQNGTSPYTRNESGFLEEGSSTLSTFFPVLKFEDGTVRVLDADELPLPLPELQEFKPSGNGESPLANATDWLWITDPKTGKKAKRETNTMPFF